jgi:MFS family permease
MPTDAPRGDRPIALGVAFGFALSLGVAVVAVPLVALGAGYDPAAIGFLAATTALAQLSTRLTLPWLLGRFADRSLVGLAALLMLAGFCLLLVSTALPAFLLAQVAQGAARAIFWTSSQTHAIRSGGSQVRRLVDLNLAGNAGTLTGPVLAGVLATFGLPYALLGAAIPAGLAAIASPLMAAYPPYDRRRSAGALRLLRRDGVDVACWANFVAGAWWSMLGSYVPVILVGAGLGSVLIGWLVTISEAAGAVMLLLIRRLSPKRIRPLVRGAALVEMAALAAIAVAPHLLVAYGALLVVGGSSAGIVTTLAPALVTLAAGEHEHGDALALSGTFRSIAQLSAPAAVGALLSLVVLPVALVGVAAATAAPGFLLGRLRSSPAAPPAPLGGA